MTVPIHIKKKSWKEFPMTFHPNQHSKKRKKEIQNRIERDFSCDTHFSHISIKVFVFADIKSGYSDSFSVVSVQL